jgi:hypothetical protein
VDEWRGLEDSGKMRIYSKECRKGEVLDRVGVQCSAVQCEGGLLVGLGCRSFLEMEQVVK